MTLDTATVHPPHKPRGPKPRRRLWIILGSLAGAVAVLLGSGYLWLMSGASVQVSGVPECHDVPTESDMAGAEEERARTGVCDAIGQLAEAWSAQDAHAYGEVFTDTATYTTFAGTYYDGREDIVASHAALYDGPLSGTRLTDRYLGLRFLTPDVAVLTTRGDTYDGDEPDEPSKVQTYTLVKDSDGDGWKVAAFQNTQRKELMEQIQFRWMPDTTPAAER